jgi:polyhydroxyalkanoate synthesis regulator phasin
MPTHETPNQTETDEGSGRRKKLIAAVTGLGLASAALLVVPAVANAQDQTEADSSSTTIEEPAEAQDAAKEESSTERGSHLEDALAPLVEDGTLTQTQADAVIEQLRETHESKSGFGPRGGHFGPPGTFGDRLDESVTDLLGISSEELFEQLRDGASLADVAESNGVDPQVLIDSMVQGAQERLDERVEEGQVTEDEAAEHAAELEQRITDRVNGELEGPPRGGPGGFGHFGENSDD